MGITKNQQEVIEYGKGSLLVEAGPGSGKTFVIVNRILHLIEKGVDPKSFLVITFTNKAADNLKFKLRKEFTKKFREELSKEISEETKENIEEIAQKHSNSIILKMQISTIHSFCFNYLKNIKEGSNKKYENLTLIDDDASERKTLFLKKYKKQLGFKGYSTIFDYHLSDVISKFDEYTSFNVDREKLTETISTSRVVSQDYKDFIDSMDYFSRKRIEDYDKSKKGKIRGIRTKMNKIKKELKALEDICLDEEEIDVKNVEELKEKIETFKQEIEVLEKETFSKSWYNQRFLQIIESYPSYLELLDKLNFVEYNTLQLKTLQELENDTNPPYKTIFVDEFQDTDPLQFRIFQELRKHCDYFTAVGDVDQHIYAFRSSFNDFFDEFKKIYSLDPLDLDVNFRSTENIVNLTEEFIRPQRESKKRDIHMKSSGKLCNNSNFIIENKDEGEESDNIFKIIKNLIDNGVKESDIAVLYRKHSSKTIANLVEIFKNEGINFSIKGQKDLGERPEVKSILNLLWYITRNTHIGYIPTNDELTELNLKSFCGEYFETSFFSLDDTTKQYLCEKQDSYYKEVIEKEYEFTDKDLDEDKNKWEEKYREKNGEDPSKYGFFINKVRNVKNRQTQDALNEIFEDLQLPIIDIEKINNPKDKEFFNHLEKIRDEIRSKDSQITEDKEIEEEEKGPLTILKVFYKLIALSNLYEYELSYNEIANLAILTQTISNYETFIYDTDFRGAFFFLNGAIKKYDSYQKEGDGVQLMTIHSAKGLEFPVTIIPSLERNNFPPEVEDPYREDDYRYGSANYYTPNDCLEYKTTLKKDETGKWVPKTISIEEENNFEKEEEDRVLYVGMTRAKYLLILSTVRKVPCQIKRIKELKDTVNCNGGKLNEEKIIELLDKVEFECEKENEKEITPEDELESLEEPVVLNYSKYTQYISCPFKFDLSYNLGFSRLGGKAANRGTVFHEIMQNLNLKLKDGEIVSEEKLAEITYDAYNQMFDIEKAYSSSEEDLSKEDKQKIADYEEFKNNVKEYYYKFSVNREVLDAELDFELFRGNYILNGAIDLIYKDSDGELVVLDYKYAKYKPDHIDGYEKQSYIYASALKEIPEYEADIKKAIIHFVLGDDDSDEPYAYEVPIVESTMNEEKGRLKEVANKIYDEVYEKEPEKAEECNHCSYRYFCKPKQFARELYD